MNLDKSDLSTKKMRKKARKEMRNKLYSNFVRSGTLTGGKMTSEEPDEEMEVTKDLSKIKELSDEQLVAACNGLTAHKGARHGHNMKAKLDRIAEAEREFMLKYGVGGDTKSKTVVEEETVTKKSKKKRKAEAELEEVIHTEKKSKKKKKKVREEIENAQCTEVPDIQDEVKRKKKKKKDKSKKDSD